MRNKRRGVKVEVWRLQLEDKLFDVEWPYMLEDYADFLVIDGDADVWGFSSFNIWRRGAQG